MVALAIVALVLLVLTIDFLVESVRWRMVARAAYPARLPEGLASIPVGFVVAAGHVWLLRDSDQSVRVGSDGFATALLGKPEEVRLLAEPGPITRGKPLALFTRQGRSITLRSPVSGTLIEHNAYLSAEAASADPFGRGWFASIRPTPDVPTESPRKRDRTSAFLAAEWERVRTFVMAHPGMPAAGATMADGGTLQPGFLLELPVPVCLDLEQAFFAIGSDDAQPGVADREEAAR